MAPPPAPRSAVVLAVGPGERRGNEEWRPYGEWEPGEDADHLVVPTLEIWLAPDPDVKAWLASADATEAVELSVNEAGPDHPGEVILTFATPGQGELDLLLPASVLDVVARAALFTGDPLVLTATTASGSLDARWWSRAGRHEPDLTFVADPASVRSAVLLQRSADSADPFEDR